MKNNEENKDIFSFDEEFKAFNGFKLCGIDEAGRGPLAGPVVAAACIIKEGETITGLNDSKKLSEKKRNALFPEIKEKSFYGIGIATEKEIDELNILHATFLAMKRALENMKVQPDLALVDGNQDPSLGVPTLTVIKGDAKSASIAAASVLAKVTRDNMMMELDEIYPQYNFKKHKGYPTKEHYERLKEFGISPCHRKSFFKRHKI